MLFLSLPGSNTYQCYRASDRGAYQFAFMPFTGDSGVQLSMEPVEVLDSHTFFTADPSPETASKAAHIGLVNRAVAEIKEQQLGKIVVARAKYVAEPLDILSLFEQLCATYTDACVYLFSHPVSGTWLGATPELLLKKSGNQLYTMSLAGTREQGQEESFTAKEVHEQVLVTDYIAETLSKTAGVEQVSVQPTELSAAGNLVHYKNKISAVLSGEVDWRQLLKNFHPTPAVAGFPKEAALRFLEAEENLNRAFYAGYFGLKQGSDFQYFVNLRCLQLFKDGYALYAGGGITADSDAEAEWEETEAKMQTLQRIIEKMG